MATKKTAAKVDPKAAAREAVRKAQAAKAAPTPAPKAPQKAPAAPPQRKAPPAAPKAPPTKGKAPQRGTGVTATKDNPFEAAGVEPKLRGGGAKAPTTTTTTTTTDGPPPFMLYSARAAKNLEGARKELRERYHAEYEKLKWNEAKRLAAADGVALTLVDVPNAELDEVAPW